MSNPHPLVLLPAVPRPPCPGDVPGPRVLW